MNRVVNHPCASTAKLGGRKQMREQLIVWMEQQGCSHALTLNVNRQLSPPKLKKLFGRFCLELDRMRYQRKNVNGIRPRFRLFAIAFVEHESTNIHLHVAVRIDGWWDTTRPADLSAKIELIWRGVTGGSGTTMLREIRDRGWGYYITKGADLRSGQYFLANDYHPNR